MSTKKPKSSAAAPVEAESFREAMRHVPAAVTVVTVGGPEPRGVTIASFSSTSLVPPLVTFNVQKGARVFPMMQRADRYAVHVLDAGQAGLSDHFADPALDSAGQFAGVPHTKGENGLPILEGAIVVLECVPWAVYDAGDHALFVGRVVRIGGTDAGDPVLYYQRSYRAVGGLIAERTL